MINKPDKTIPTILVATFKPIGKGSNSNVNIVCKHHNRMYGATKERIIIAINWAILVVKRRIICMVLWIKSVI